MGRKPTKKNYRRNSDESLRKLGRHRDDAPRLLLQKQRAGLISAARIFAAAEMGEPTALQVYPDAKSEKFPGFDAILGKLLKDPEANTSDKDSKLVFALFWNVLLKFTKERLLEIASYEQHLAESPTTWYASFNLNNGAFSTALINIHYWLTTEDANLDIVCIGEALFWIENWDATQGNDPRSSSSLGRHPLHYYLRALTTWAEQQISHRMTVEILWHMVDVCITNFMQANRIRPPNKKEIIFDEIILKMRKDLISENVKILPLFEQSKRNPLDENLRKLSRRGDDPARELLEKERAGLIPGYVVKAAAIAGVPEAAQIYPTEAKLSAEDLSFGTRIRVFFETLLWEGEYAGIKTAFKLLWQDYKRIFKVPSDPALDPLLAPLINWQMERVIDDFLGWLDSDYLTVTEWLNYQIKKWKDFRNEEYSINEFQDRILEFSHLIQHTIFINYEPATLLHVEICKLNALNNLLFTLRSVTFLKPQDFKKFQRIDAIDALMGATFNFILEGQGGLRSNFHTFKTLGPQETLVTKRALMQLGQRLLEMHNYHSDSDSIALISYRSNPDENLRKLIKRGDDPVRELLEKQRRGLVNNTILQALAYIGNPIAVQILPDYAEHAKNRALTSEPVQLFFERLVITPQSQLPTVPTIEQKVALKCAWQLLNQYTRLDTINNSEITIVRNFLNKWFGNLEESFPFTVSFEESLYYSSNYLNRFIGTEMHGSRVIKDLQAILSFIAALKYLIYLWRVSSTSERFELQINTAESLTRCFKQIVAQIGDSAEPLQILSECALSNVLISGHLRNPDESLRKIIRQGDDPTRELLEKERRGMVDSEIIKAAAFGGHPVAVQLYPQNSYALTKADTNTVKDFRWQVSEIFDVLVYSYKQDNVKLAFKAAWHVLTRHINLAPVWSGVNQPLSGSQISDTIGNWFRGSQVNFSNYLHETFGSAENVIQFGQLWDRILQYLITQYDDGYIYEEDVRKNIPVIAYLRALDNLWRLSSQNYWENNQHKGDTSDWVRQMHGQHRDIPMDLTNCIWELQYIGYNGLNKQERLLEELAQWILPWK